ANIKSNIAEASKLRPAAFGQSGYVENEDTVASLHSIHMHGMEPVQLAEYLKAGIEANQLYIIPYPEAKDGLRQHFDQIVEAVLPMEADPEGARLRTEALQKWAAGRAAAFNEKQD
ncbi:MAG: dehydrogenase, partial [Chakrabartia godavariana]